MESTAVKGAHTSACDTTNLRILSEVVFDKRRRGGIDVFPNIFTCSKQNFKFVTTTNEYGKNVGCFSEQFDVLFKKQNVTFFTYFARTPF